MDDGWWTDVTDDFPKGLDELYPQTHRIYINVKTKEYRHWVKNSDGEWVEDV